MQSSVYQQPKVAVAVHLIMAIILGVSAYVLFRQLPQGMNPDAIMQAVNSGQTHLLTLTLAAFGVGLGGNYLLSALGHTLNRPALGKIVVGLLFIIVIGGLVMGVAANWLTGISVPFVMNPGMGLVVGSGLGWWGSGTLPRQSLAIWSIGAIAALVTVIALMLLG